MFPNLALSTELENIQLKWLLVIRNPITATILGVLRILLTKTNALLGTSAEGENKARWSTNLRMLPVDVSVWVVRPPLHRPTLRQRVHLRPVNLCIVQSPLTR